MGIKERVKGLGVKGLAVIMALIVVASAATVAYLSNTVSANVDVSSPFELVFTSPGTGSSVSIDTFGGSTVQMQSTLENRANNAVHAATKLTCDDGADTMTCEQLAMQHKTLVTAGSATGYQTDYAALPCAVVSGNAVYTIQAGYDFPAGHKSTDDFKATFAPAVVGTVICTATATPT